MKLTSEHIGRKVRRKFSGSFFLIGIDGERVWVKGRIGETWRYETCENDEQWELVEEPKKPSEIIMAMGNGTDSACRLSHNILKWLDEHWDKRNG